MKTALSILLFLLIACNNNISSIQETTGYVEFTLNGGNYTNQTFRYAIDDPPGMMSVNYGYYDPVSQRTYCNVFDGEPGLSLRSFFLRFSGNTSATYIWETSTLEHIMMISIPANEKQSKLLSPLKGKTTITGYGDVGGLIEGIFEGSVNRHVSGNNGAKETLNISGKFWVQRGRDQSIDDE